MSHHPPHIYMDDTWYMISARTVKVAACSASRDIKS